MVMECDKPKMGFKYAEKCDNCKIVLEYAEEAAHFKIGDINITLCRLCAKELAKNILEEMV